MAYDLVVIGGGLVGLATAYQFTQLNRGSRVAVLEKESAVAQHQSSHNSGVLHTGVYYKPGSLKAQNCSEGKRLMEQFCSAHGVAFAICGKLIIATEERELQALANIAERGRANGVRCEEISSDRIREFEPHAAGVRALWVKDAGVVDFPAVAQALVKEIEKAGGVVHCGAAAHGIREIGKEVVVETNRQAYAAKRLVNAAGLFCDRVLKMAGVKPPCQIVPFRGEYYVLKAQYAHLCRTLIYPVPNPDFPFLGVHYTRGVHGEVECGPNAVLALAREGYSWSRMDPVDLAESILYPGLYRFMWRYARESWGEIQRSFSKKLFVAALQRLIPEIREEYLEPGPTGVRAQAMVPDGKLVDDFLLHQTARSIHVLNAPSPAATSSLSIGKRIVQMLG